MYGNPSRTGWIARLSLVLGCLALFAIGATAARAQAEVEATAVWGAPTTGTPVDYYVLQHSVNGSAWTTVAAPVDATYAFQVTTGDSHQVRVAGVDAEGRQGPYSLPSDPFIPGSTEPGPPGEPGKPVLY